MTTSVSNTTAGYFTSHIMDKPVASGSTELNTKDGELHVGTKNTIRWAALQGKHGFTTSPLFGDFVLKHMQRFVTDWEDAYHKITQTPLSHTQGITRFQWVSGILQPFNAFGHRLPTLTVNKMETTTNKAIRMANDAAFFATLTGFGQNTQSSSRLGSPEQHSGRGQTSNALRRHQLSRVTFKRKLDKQSGSIYIGPINKAEFGALKETLGFKTGPELGDFVLDQMEEMSKDWEFLYTMIDLTGQKGALNVKDFRWGEWGIHGPNLKEALRQAFDLLMGINVDVTQEISYLNLFPAFGLSFNAGVGETAAPENTNADCLQQGNSEYFPAYNK